MGCWCALMRLVARSQITDYARLIALTSRATPLGFEPRITPPKGAVLPLHHGVIRIHDFRCGNGSCNSRSEKLVRARIVGRSSWPPTKSNGGEDRRPTIALVKTTSPLGYSPGLGKRISTVVPLR